NDKKGAFKEYTKAIEVAPTTARYYFERAKRYYLSHNIDAALKDMKAAIKYDPERISYKEILAKWSEDHNISPEEIEAEEFSDDNLKENPKSFKNIMQGLKEKIFGKKSSSSLFLSVLPLPPVLSQILMGNLTLEQLFNNTPAIRKAFEDAEEATFEEIKSISETSDVYTFLTHLVRQLKINNIDPQKGHELLETSKKYMISQFSKEERVQEAQKFMGMMNLLVDLGQDKPEMMIEVCNDALDWDDTNTELYLMRFSYEQDTDLKQAKKDLEKIIELNPNVTEYRNLYAKFLSMYGNFLDLEKPSKNIFKDFLHNIDNLLHAKKPAVAEVAIDEEAQAQSIAEAAYQKVLKSYNASALAYYNLAIEKNPKKAEYYYERALVKQDAFSDYDGATEDFTTAMELDPENADFYMEQASNAISIKNLRQEEAQKYKSIIDYKINNGEYEDAIKYLDTAIEIDPNNDVFYNLRAFCFFNLQNMRGAFENINKAIEHDPTKVEYLITLSTINIAMNNFQGAFEALDKAISIKKDDGYLYFSRAQLKYIAQDIKGAFLDLREALKYDDKNPVAHFLMALVKYEFEDYKGSLASVDKAIELD
ncbi:MAG: tetratricopeptide repeat protein, partial [Elusimicrobiaceae bacterium]|nr:tetratricopeptide repeat protein [Elusimicrobiaceae bacterium]